MSVSAYRGWGGCQTAGAVSLLIFLGAAGSVEGQEPKKKVVPWEGSQAFTQLLSAFQLKPIEKRADIFNLPPPETVIIVFGDSRVLRDIRLYTHGLQNFRAQGGAVLVATENSWFGLQRSLGISVTGEIVIQDERRSYRNDGRMPLINKFLQEEHPLFKDVKQGVATNMPSEIFYSESSSLIPLADFTSPTNNDFKLRFRQRHRPKFDPIWKRGYTFMIGSRADAPAQDRVLIIADRTLFMNGMIVQPDNDNFIFAYNCVRWLAAGRRKNVVFFEDGKLVTKFDVPLAQTPRPPIPDEAWINLLLNKMQEVDGFHKMMFEARPKHRWIQYILLALSVLIFARLLYRGFHARHRRESRLPLVSRSLEKAASSAPLFTRRYETMMEQNSYWEPARFVAREWFAENGFGEALAEAPAVHCEQSNWQRRKWQRRLDYLWRLAWGRKPLRLTARQFRALQERMQLLDAALANGEIRVHSAGAPSNPSYPVLQT